MTQQSQPAGRPSSATASTNTSLFEVARAVIPGGVDSPVRAFGSVGGTPRFIASASGAHVTDAEGRSYVDLVGSWGPALTSFLCRWSLLVLPMIIDQRFRLISQHTCLGDPGNVFPARPEIRPSHML